MATKASTRKSKTSPAVEKGAVRVNAAAGMRRLKRYIGLWVTEGKGPMGTYRCERVFEELRGGKYLRLTVVWDIPGGKYEELAVYGVDPASRRLRFWSFTSDGKRSEGELTAPADVAKDALCFEADFSGRRARMIWSPVGPEGFTVAVEARNKKGWKRFLEQQFRVP
jgi:hypothetical protein